MKSLKHLIFTIAMVIGLALSVSAQKDDKRNRPPKGDAPKIVVPDKDKPPRGNPPKEDRPKKPGADYLVSVTREDDIV